MTIYEKIKLDQYAHIFLIRYLFRVYTKQERKREREREGEIEHKRIEGFARRQ